MALGAENLRTLFDPSSCVRKGLCPVSRIREQGEPLESHSLYYEQHGTGPVKIVFIMGLNSSSFAWSTQVDHFGSLSDYSILVFDNRGVGNSGAPKGPYSTSGMAEDVIVLLGFIGWTEYCSLHIVGVSLGGMIAQELSSRIPERIISLTLAVTTPGGRPWNNFAPRKGTMSLIRLLTVKDPVDKIPIILSMCYPLTWLDEKAKDDPKGRTNRQIQSEVLARRFAITRPQTFIGSISQMCAALTHRVTPDRLGKISSSIPKVIIVTGDADDLVDPRNSFRLKEAMPEAEFVQWKNTGHAIHTQDVKRFNEMLKRVFEEGKAKVT